MRYLYHLTRPEYLDQILTEGLKPMIGNNSKRVNEEKPMIYLTEKKYLPYWNMLLGQPGILLRINMSYVKVEKCHEWTYSFYKEYVSDELIPKEAVSIVKSPNIGLGNIDVETRQEFKLSIVDDISKICELIARLALDPENEYHKFGYDDAVTSAFTNRQMLAVMDFSEITPEILKKHLIFLCEECGAYTICDVDYANSDNNDKRGKMRLYEHLNKAPYATEDTKWLYNWLISNYSQILDTDTGGWGC